MDDHTLWTLLHELAKDHEELPALRYREEEEIVGVTYGKLLRDLEIGTQRAAALPKSRVGIWGESDYSWIVATFSCLLAGKHVVLLDHTIDRNDLQHLVAYADVEAIVASAAMTREAEKHFPDMPVFCFDAFTRSARHGAGDTFACQPPVAPEQDFIIFTSGTSSSAKGVVITVRALTDHLRLFKHALPGNAFESYFLPIPFFHIFGFLMICEVLNRNGVFCISGGVRMMRQDLWTYRAANVTMVPSMIKFVLDTTGFPPETRAVITGGSLCPTEYQEELRKRGIPAYAMYGMSETLGIVGVSERDADIRRYRIVDGVQVQLSELGEVQATIPCHFKEYYKKEEETCEILSGDTVMTGDLGEFDETGCLRILGRLGDIIVLRNGEKLNAVDVDKEVSALPGVMEAAAFGVDGYPVLAFTPDDSFDEERFQQALTQYNRGRPVSKKLVRIWNYRAPLPRTSTGKLKRNQLMAEYRDLQAGKN